MPDTLLAYLHPNDIPATFHKSLVDLLGFDMTHGQHLGPWASVRCATGGVPEGRNQVMAQFLATDGIDWLFMVDADMGFAPDIVERLHRVADATDRPIVGGLCFAQRENADDGLHGFRCEARPTIYDYIDHPDGHRRFTGRAHYPANSLVRCAATGAACLLIHKSVARRVFDEYGATWFDRVRGTDGSLLGEDISFFVRTSALEVPLHVHTGIRLTHFKNVWLGEVDFWSQFVPPPATERATVIVPVLNRPDNVRPLVESLRASTGLADVLFVTEPDDLTEWAAIDAVGAARMTHPGTFAEKVNAACRAGIATPWVLLVGDDVVFRPGWLDHAQFVAHKFGGKVVATNDLGNPRVMAGEHATHPLISVDYIAEQGASWDGPGVVCHEGYRHWFVDDEITTAAKQRGVFQAALGAIVEHRHPIFGKASDDEVYRLGQSHAQRDAALFKKRARQYAA